MAEGGVTGVNVRSTLGTEICTGKAEEPRDPAGLGLSCVLCSNRASPSRSRSRTFRCYPWPRSLSSKSLQTLVGLLARSLQRTRPPPAAFLTRHLHPMLPCHWPTMPPPRQRRRKRKSPRSRPSPRANPMSNLSPKTTSLVRWCCVLVATNIGGISAHTMYVLPLGLSVLPHHEENRVRGFNSR